MRAGASRTLLKKLNVDIVQIFHYINKILSQTISDTSKCVTKIAFTNYLTRDVNISHNFPPDFDRHLRDGGKL